MGRIKTTLIKRTSRKLFRWHKEQFTADFEKDKPVLRDILVFKNKKMRNVVLGYITRLKKMELKNA